VGPALPWAAEREFLIWGPRQRSPRWEMAKIRKEDMPVVFRHRHCIWCSAPVLDMEKEFCSAKCEAEYRRQLRRRNWLYFAMMLSFPIMVLLLYLIPLIFK